jgi:hydrogenase nickel incorporation protein HypA/HybF
MHELSVCQGLLREVARVAAEHDAVAVDRIVLRVGRLSGVEPPLLLRAFEVARAGTLAESAELEIQAGPVIVQCRQCGARGEVAVNRLVCPDCGDWRVQVVEGEELLLLKVDIEKL